MEVLVCKAAVNYLDQEDVFPDSLRERAGRKRLQAMRSGNVCSQQCLGGGRARDSGLGQAPWHL